MPATPVPEIEPFDARNAGSRSCVGHHYLKTRLLEVSSCSAVSVRRHGPDPVRPEGPTPIRGQYCEPIDTLTFKTQVQRSESEGREENQVPTAVVRVLKPPRP